MIAATMIQNLSKFPSKDSIEFYEESVGNWTEPRKKHGKPKKKGGIKRRKN